MKKLKFNHLIALASTLSLVAGSQAVYAQAAEPEEVIVTGFKASLEKAAEIKQNSTGIMEVVTAEDIGKLPDKSIAESLMRLPGLATQRVNGRPQVISIRGMDPDYSNTLLNGRQQASTGLNRSVEYDQYPAEFVSAAMVYKTPDAAVLGQGVAGTIDMRTVRPLAFGKQAIVANVRYEQNEDEALNSAASNVGNKETLSYIDQFNDNTVGVALGFSHTDTPTQTKYFHAWGFAPTYMNKDGNLTGDEFYDQAHTERNQFQYGTIGGVQPFVESNELKRNSIIGTLEYAPSESFSTSVDIFYSKFTEDVLRNGIEIPLAWNGRTHLLPGFTVQDGVVTSGQFTGTAGIIRNDAELRNSELYAVAWNTKFDLGDSWTGVVDISTSSADSKNLSIQNYAGFVNTEDTLAFVTDSKGTHFTSHMLDYSDTSKVKVANPQGWGNSILDPNEGGQKAFTSHPHITDDLTQIRLSASRDLDFGMVKKVEIGLNRDSRSKFATVAPELLYGFDDFAKFGDLPAKTYTTDFSYMGLGKIVSFNPRAIIDDPRMRSVEDVSSGVVSRTWTVDEDITTAYIKLDLESTLGDTPVTGNIGLQIVNADQSSDGTSSSGAAGSFTQIAQYAEENYTDVLPSLNLRFALTEQDYIKMGMARSLTRPRMDQLQNSSSFSLSASSLPEGTSATLDNSPWSANGGNTHLKPWKSDSLDVSYEHYFAEGIGYFSAAGYYKYLESYVFTKRTVMDFSDFPVNVTPAPTYFQGWRSVPTNGGGGYLNGVEFNLTITGAFINPAWTNVGMVYNLSHNNSSIHPADTVPHTLPGLSEDVKGLQLFYEENGFSARISQNYRSGFNGETAGALGGRSLRYFDSVTLVDAQIGYTFQTGHLAGLGITLQGYNLTDEPSVTRAGGREMEVIDYHSYGKSYALNINYAF